jgi:hypothetical protein
VAVACAPVFAGPKLRGYNARLPERRLTEQPMSLQITIRDDRRKRGGTAFGMRNPSCVATGER